MSAHPAGHRSHSSTRRWMQNDSGRKKDRLVAQIKAIARRLLRLVPKQTAGGGR